LRAGLSSLKLRYSWQSAIAARNLFPQQSGLLPLVAYKSHIVEVSGVDLISGNIPCVSRSDIVGLSAWVVAVFIHKLTVLPEPYM